MKLDSTGLSIREPLIDNAESIAAIQVAGWRTAFRGIASDDYLDRLDPAAERRGMENRHRQTSVAQAAGASSPSSSPRSSDSSPSSRHGTRTSTPSRSARSARYTSVLSTGGSGVGPGIDGAGSRRASISGLHRRNALDARGSQTIQALLRSRRLADRRLNQGNEPRPPRHPRPLSTMFAARLGVVNGSRKLIPNR